MPVTWRVWQSHMQQSIKRSWRINKVHRIKDLWWRPIDQLGADCSKHSEMPMGIITKSEVRQNYCIRQLWHLTDNYCHTFLEANRRRQSDCDVQVLMDKVWLGLLLFCVCMYELHMNQNCAFFDWKMNWIELKNDWKMSLIWIVHTVVWVLSWWLKLNYGVTRHHPKPKETKMKLTEMKNLLLWLLRENGVI